MAKKIILDCDPGHDDAIALILAYGNPDIDLLAVTTVGGNAVLEKTTKNAMGVMTMAGILDVPFAPGCSRPLWREGEDADVHGESGLDGVVLPPSQVTPDGRHGVDLIIDTIMSNEPKSVTLVPTGPLTNIAMAMRKEPRIIELVKEVVLMGGGIHVGNWSAVAEFNIKIDPEAAAIVFDAPWEVTMVGLDVTHQALATDEVSARIKALNTPLAEFVLGLFTFFQKAYHDEQGFEFPPVHDPVAVARVIDPSIVGTVRAPINVELTGTHTLGMTVTELRPAHIPADCHTQAATSLDAERFWDLVIDAIDRLGKRDAQ
ncbi:ribonucleoside hydrolase [Actinotignum sanguinis]|uniref:uridine-preferring nucleoside hydrolase UriH n=1 Tax=Actinotignum sanguinis TaxID=1445614 RepID=UPI000F7F815C|nr:nucleoside hydrolase [Actinotignum sanguinis]MDY5147848.1 nucleoside hydrolase [Actinotignum sanguinis]RTE49722.1 ribonucleoside hydrolase [Actinotignum sanguinis]